MSPFIVSGDASKVPFLNFIIMILALISMILSLFAKATPKTPPSASAGTKNLRFWVGIKTLFKNSYYVLLLLIFGFFVGTFNVYVTLLSSNA